MTTVAFTRHLTHGKNNLPAGDKAFYCDCTEHCKRRKKVSKGTYYSHKRFRDQDVAQFNQTAPSELVDVQSAHTTGQDIPDISPNLNGKRTNELDPLHAGKRQCIRPEILGEVDDPGRLIDENVNFEMDSPRMDDHFPQYFLPNLNVDLTDGDPHVARNRDPESEAGSTSLLHNPVYPLNSDEDEEEETLSFSRIEDIKIAQQFIAALKSASLDNGDLDDKELENLLNPESAPVDIDSESERELLLCLRIFLAQINSSQETYTGTLEAIRIAYPEDELLSYDQIKWRIACITGVYAIIKDMCPNSCIAYTGPFKALDHCPRCNETRNDPSKQSPRQQFYMLPIGPVIQAMKRQKLTAEKMDYFNQKTQEALKELQRSGSLERLDDICCGTDILTQVHEGKISGTDTVLMFSLDGAQLYRNKVSDCWIYIWIFVSLSPDERYKKKFVIPGGVIPGPSKPKIVESFLFPGLHHVAAVNRQGGLPVYDAAKERRYASMLYIVLATADGPGMTYLNGLVGHSGKNGCRLWCGMIGRHKPGGSHYYPVLFKPNGYIVNGSDHDDVNPVASWPINPQRYNTALQKVCESPTQARFEENRRETGICKPSIFSGLGDYTLGIPNMFPGDVMHLILNLADILMNLWRATLDCSSTDSKRDWTWATLQGDLWRKHGQDVANSTPYLPGSFDRPPRNPAEKINSGYKAWEFLLYLFGLGPGLFYKVLPDEIWKSYCKLVSGIRIIYQKKITKTQYKTAHLHLITFTIEFENLYVQRRKDRLHFVRQSIHVSATQSLKLFALAQDQHLLSGHWNER
ncbi:hypothetical protein M413DRAFT_31260 [Hebeloma cylindrosporum]|uniref:Uncharacterized protein n=1 Tax=Hebeloma cylindrosporum TaxID=76867 RepID=A0A0C2Y739_HEBCY|nr:hypothetical protein M413DRAFT_31260 [Hebeloma cylindrosporum h7]